MDFQALYQSKLTTAAEAAKLVKSGGFVGLLQEVERKIDSEDYLSAYDLVEKRFT